MRKWKDVKTDKAVIDLARNMEALKQSCRNNIARADAILDNTDETSPRIQMIVDQRYINQCILESFETEEIRETH